MQTELAVQFPQHPGIVRSLEKRQLVVVVGPLVREAAGLLGTRGLIEAGLEHLTTDDAARDHIRAQVAAGKFSAAFEAIKDRLGPSFSAVFEPLLAGPKVAPPASLRALAGLAGQLRLILTTNLDSLVETTLSGRWTALEEAKADLAARTETVFKMLGTAHRVSSWRFTADGLQNATYRAPHLRQEIAAVLRAHQLLLIGYRGDDELLAELVRLREHAPEDRNAPQWVALVPPGTSPFERVALGKRGLHLVALDGAGDDPIAYDQAVAAYLLHLAQATPQVELAGPMLETKIAGNPYPGLAPFVEAQARQFFGRTEDCAALVGKLGRRGPVHVRWLALTGPSGVGKSSVLAAGLVPAIRVGAPPIPGAPTQWVVAQLRPGRELLRNLAASVRNALAHDLGAALAPELLSRDMLIAQDRALADFLAPRLQGRGLLLVLDQFEEAFTVDLAEDRPYLDALLVRSLQDLEVPFYLVTAIRSDCAGDLGRYFPRLAEQQNGGSLSARHDLQPLRPHELRDAIEWPAELAGRVFEPGLVDRILRDAGALHAQKTPGETPTDASADNLRDAPDAALPLVAHVLKALHDQAPGRTLSLRAYESLGGVAESLTRSADALLASLRDDFSPEQVRGLLIELVELHPQGRDTRRVLPWATAVAAAGGDVDAGARARAEALLRRLSGGTTETLDTGPAVRLIATRGEGEHAVVDLVHDALLREWTTLREWLQEDRELGLLRQELAHAADGWTRHGRPDDELWRGGRLARAAETLRALRLLPDAQAFLAASTAREQAEAASKAAAQSEKLRAAEALAAAESARTADARRNNRWLLAFGGVLLIVAVVALFEYRRADVAASLAVNRLTAANRVVNQILFEALPELGSVPGSAAVQKKIHTMLVDLQATLLQDAKNDRETLRSRMVQHGVRGDLALTHDDLILARQEYEAGLRLAEQLAQDLAKFSAQRDLAVVLVKLGDVEQNAGNLTAARAHFERSLSIVGKMVEQDPDNAGLRRDLSDSLNQLGEVEQTAGNLTAARAHYERSLSIVEKIVEQDPDNAAFRHQLSVSLNQLGEVEQTAGNLTAARAHFERSLSIVEKMVEQDPDNAAFRHHLSLSLVNLGGVEQTAGNLTAARPHFERSLSIVDKMVEQDPDNAALRHHLSVSLVWLGVVEQIAGNLMAARAHFERSLSIVEKMVEQDPDNAGLRRDLSVSLNQLGEVEQKAGNLTAARPYFERSLSIDEKMVEQDPDNAAFRRTLSVSLVRLGDVEQTAGNLTAARPYFERSVSIFENMAEQDPDNASLRLDISVSLNQLGDVEQDAGNLTAARSHFERSLSIDEKMVEQDPDNAGRRRLLSVSLNKLGDVERTAGNLTAARSHFERSLSIFEKMVEQDPDNASVRFDLILSHMKLFFLATEERNQLALRKHLTAADAVLDDMETKGQLQGFAQGEAVRASVNNFLTKLPN